MYPKRLLAILISSFVLPMAWQATAQPRATSSDSTSEHVGALVDSWHAAAGAADADTYFGLMAEDAVYIGTEAGERWTKPEFVEFGKPYFDRGSAWDFTSTTRHVYLSDDGQIAWFEELLDTWMGVCAGSGVLQKTDEGWRIKHYHLSVTVPNALINEFIEMVKTGSAMDEPHDG
ncbi:MAG: nuclear transport factor 2 family protein [Rhodothermales bacterium]|nr:nuclear transport factor 2 family protein [Rhodothermales bacterium]